ncbi:MAG: helix-turn-helix domain-containing protein [Acidobacteriota bacterium]
MHYQLLKHEKVDLAKLSKADLAFLVHLSRRAIADEDYAALVLAVKGRGAYPRRGRRWVTSPLQEADIYRVAEDIVDRVGIRQGLIAPDADDSVTAVDQVVGVTEAARLLGITRAAVVKAARAGRLKGRQIGKAWALLRGSVQRYRVAHHRVIAGRAARARPPVSRARSVP